MQKAMRGLPFCSVFIDDIILFSDLMDAHLEHLKQVFDRLRQVRLKLHPQKCCFMHPEVPFLGHIVSATGIRPNPDKVRAVREIRVPTNVKMVREFLRLAG